MPRLKGLSAKVAVKPENVLLKVDLMGESSPPLPPTSAVKPGHQAVVIPLVMLDRLEKAFQDASTRPAGISIQKALQFADFLLTKDIYLKQQAGLRPQDRRPFHIHQKSLEGWKLDEDGNQVGPAPIGKAIGKLVKLFLGIGLLTTKASRTGRRASYRVGKESASYWLDESIYQGALVAVQVRIKVEGGIPAERVLERTTNMDKDAKYVVENLRKLRVDWTGLLTWVRTQWNAEVAPTILVEVRKVILLALGQVSLGISEFGRFTHNMTGIQGGVRAFVEFEGYEGKVELDLSSSHSTLFMLFLRDILNGPPGPGIAKFTTGRGWTNWRDHYTGNVFPSNGTDSYGPEAPNRLSDPIPLSRSFSYGNALPLNWGIGVVSIDIWEGDAAFRESLSRELSMFRDVIRAKGGIYQDVQEFLVAVLGLDPYTVATIDNLKVATLAFYCGPHFRVSSSARANTSSPPEPVFLDVPMVRYFEAKFPCILRLLLLFKHYTPVPELAPDQYDPDSHLVFAHLCLNLESDLVLHRIMPVLAQMGIPCIPIHDGIEVPLLHWEKAVQVFEKVLHDLDLDGHLKAKPVDKSNPRPFSLNKLPKELRSSIDLEEEGAREFDPSMSPWRA